MRNWWRSIGFYWQVYVLMALAFGGIITLVEAVVEPLLLNPIVENLNLGTIWTEVVMWIASVLIPSLLLGYLMTHMVVRRLRSTVEMAKKLTYGDLRARIATTEDEKDVFNQLARVFNEMADSLERLFYFEKRLLTDISHELRSPLTRIGLATAILPMKRDSDDFEKNIRLIESEIEQLNVMVGLLLEQGRERLNSKNEYSQVDVSALATDLTDGYALVATSEGKTLSVEIEPDVSVWANEIRLRTILDNIISNAIFYSPVDDQIIVSLKLYNSMAIFSVRDFGPGVPDDCLQDIFRAFFRIDPSRARTSGGAGLGLALAKDAAVAIGGDIEARNAQPGLEVLVTLPLNSVGMNGSAKK